MALSVTPFDPHQKSAACLSRAYEALQGLAVESYTLESYNKRYSKFGTAQRELMAGETFECLDEDARNSWNTTAADTQFKSFVFVASAADNNYPPKDVDEETCKKLFPKWLEIGSGGINALVCCNTHYGCVQTTLLT